MVDRNSPTSRIEEDLSLVKKVTSNGVIVKDLNVLQADDSEVYCNQFEKNGRQFKQQLENRLKRSQGIYERTSKSPDKNLTLFQIEREQKLVK